MQRKPRPIQGQGQGLGSSSKPSDSDSADALPASALSTLSVSDSTARKLRAIYEHLTSVHHERSEHVLALLAGILGGHHVLFLGLPGTGKTKLSRHAARLLGCRFNSKCLSSGSRIDSIIGPLDIAAYNQGLNKRILTYGACGAEVVFFDEFFRADLEELFQLLPILEEREYDNGEGMEPIPLRSLIAATNFIPDLDRVGALWRRLPIKLSAESLSDEGRDSFLQQLCSGSNVLSSAEEPEPLTPEEVAEIAASVKISRASLPAAMPYWLSAVCHEIKAAGAWNQQTPESLGVVLADVFATTLTINRILAIDAADIVQFSATLALDWLLFLPGERERPSHSLGSTTAIFTELYQVQRNLVTTFMQVAPGLAASVATVKLHLGELTDVSFSGANRGHAVTMDPALANAIKVCLQEIRSPTACAMATVTAKMLSTFAGRLDDTKIEINAIHDALGALSVWAQQIENESMQGPFNKISIASAINNDRPLVLLEKAMNVCSKEEYIPF